MVLLIATLGVMIGSPDRCSFLAVKKEREREKIQLRFNSEDEEGMRMRTYMVRLSNGIWNGKVIAFELLRFYSEHFPILSVSVTITL